MKNGTIIAVLLVIAVFAVIEISRRIAAGRYSQKLTQALLNEAYTEFDQLAQKWFVRYLLPPFNLDHLKLTAYLAQDKQKEIDAQFERFDRCRLNSRQKKTVFTKGFYYYLGKENTEKTQKYYKELKEILSGEEAESIDRLYSVYVEKSDRYLPEVLKDLENAPKEKVAQYAALAAAMYANRGEEKEAQKYYSLSMKEQRKMMKGVLARKK